MALAIWLFLMRTKLFRIKTSPWKRVLLNPGPSRPHVDFRRNYCGRPEREASRPRCPFPVLSLNSKNLFWKAVMVIMASKVFLTGLNLKNIKFRFESF